MTPAKSASTTFHPMLSRVAAAALLVALASLMTGVSGGTTSPRPDLSLGSGEVPTPLLAIRPTEGWGGTLGPVDPLSLRPLGTTRVDLKGAVFGWSFSPDRSRLALGDQYGRVLFVDATRMRRLGELRTGLKAPLAASAWVDGRLLAAWRGPGVVRVRSIDPVKRRVLRK
jgi:hypothetical protein